MKIWYVEGMHMLKVKGLRGCQGMSLITTYPATDMKAVNCLSSVTDVHHGGPRTKVETQHR